MIVVEGMKLLLLLLLLDPSQTSQSEANAKTGMSWCMLSRFIGNKHET
jgi:hypothetical protein